MTQYFFNLSPGKHFIDYIPNPDEPEKLKVSPASAGLRSRYALSELKALRAGAGYHYQI